MIEASQLRMYGYGSLIALILLVAKMLSLFEFMIIISLWAILLKIK